MLNKKCKYCTTCDLIIAKKSEVESLMSYKFERVDPSIVGNKYFVFGTLSRSDWQQYSKTPTGSGIAIDEVYVFKDVLDFEIVRGGWYKPDEAKTK
jgi:hypothetical protein